MRYRHQCWKVIPRTECDQGRERLWNQQLKTATCSNSKELATAAAKSLQSCPTLCNPIDGSPRGSPVPGILQARTLEWVAISFSNAWKWKVKVKSLSCVRLSATPWTAAYQAPLSMGLSRQEYWRGVPLPSPPMGDSTGGSVVKNLPSNAGTPVQFLVRELISTDWGATKSFYHNQRVRAPQWRSCAPQLRSNTVK